MQAMVLTFERSELMNLRRATLQELCGVKQLSQTGTESDLVDRLVHSGHESGESPITHAFACPFIGTPQVGVMYGDFVDRSGAAASRR